MNLVCFAVMLGWIPFIFALISIMTPSRAVASAFVIGWLFLPNITLPVPGLPDVGKALLTTLVTLLVLALLRPEQFRHARFHWLDLFAVGLSLSSGVASISNDLGLYDACSQSFAGMMRWMGPYWLGRMCLSTPAKALEFCKIIVFLGLVYVPLCAFELRMSPQLHLMVYGVPNQWLGQRLGGWRPAVFMWNGLMLGLWMSAVTLVAFWLWRNYPKLRITGAPMGVVFLILLATTILCKSTGALAILVGGVASLLGLTASRSKAPLFCLWLLVPLYIGTRVTGVWSGEGVLEVAGLVSADRRDSFDFRLRQEDKLLRKAFQRPLFGWGGFGRNRVYNESGRDVSVTDGLWVIQFGTTGLFGMICLYGVLLSPTAMVLKNESAASMAAPPIAAVTALALVTLFFAIDSLPNAMYNPVYVLACGSVVGVYVGNRTSTKGEPPPRQTVSKGSPSSVIQRKLVTGEPHGLSRQTDESPSE